MKSGKQTQSDNIKNDKTSNRVGFDEYSSEFETSIASDDLSLHPDQKEFTPRQVIQLQRVIGNQATLQLMRKTKAKSVNFSGLKMVQREPDPNDNVLEPPPLMSTGLPPQTHFSGSLPKPESTITKFMDKSNPVVFATAVFRDFTHHLQLNPTDDTYAQYWQDDEVDHLANGWMEMDTGDKEKNQYLMTQLIKQSPELETAVNAKVFEESDKTVGTTLEVIEGGINVGALTSSGFSTKDGVDLAMQLKDGIETVKTAGGVFEATFGSILSIAWLPLVIGYEAVRAFKYNKKRRDGYKAAMDSHKDAKDKQGVKLFNISKYAYQKTKRAFNYSMAKIALKIVRMIALIITLLTGGTSAIVTASIAAIAAVVETLGSLYRKVKGFFKKITGKRGANRQKNAEELVGLAKKGNVDAAQTIIDVNPFDGVTMKAIRAISNKAAPVLLETTMNPVTNSRQLMQGLEKPKTPEELIFLLSKRPQHGGWTVEHETMLVRALANTMVSQ